jgi:hypothetical protein
VTKELTAFPLLNSKGKKTLQQMKKAKNTSQLHRGAPKAHIHCEEFHQKRRPIFKNKIIESYQQLKQRLPANIIFLEKK